MLTDNKNNAELNADLSGADRRIDPRLYFHDGETPLELQAHGIPVVLHESGFIFQKRIGRAVVKDFSLGGIGFLAPEKWHLNKYIYVEFQDKKIYQCEILHQHSVVPLLNFYGARWYKCDRRDLKKTMLYLYEVICSKW